MTMTTTILFSTTMTMTTTILFSTTMAMTTTILWGDTMAATWGSTSMTVSRRSSLWYAVAATSGVTMAVRVASVTITMTSALLTTCMSVACTIKHEQTKDAHN